MEQKSQSKFLPWLGFTLKSLHCSLVIAPEHVGDFISILHW